MAFSLAHDVHVGEHVVRIRCAGTGRPLLLLHDIGGSGASFAGVTSAIVAAGREAVAPDLPGFAQSDPIPGGVAGVIAHLHELTDQTITEPIDVVGRGFGAYLALSLAAQRPDRYRRIVVEDPLSPPRGGGRASGRMSAGMALNGALTTVRRGRILQNVGGFGRAKALLEELSKPDQEWWDGLRQISAQCLLIDTGGGRSEDRTRAGFLSDALAEMAVTSFAGRKSAEVDAERAIIDFVC